MLKVLGLVSFGLRLDCVGLNATTAAEIAEYMCQDCRPPACGDNGHASSAGQSVVGTESGLNEVNGLVDEGRDAIPSPSRSEGGDLAKEDDFARIRLKLSNGGQSKDSGVSVQIYNLDGQQMVPVAQSLQPTLDLSQPATVLRSPDNSRATHNSGQEVVATPPKLYCICKKEYDARGPPMIGCETCGNWFHLPCVGLTVDSLDAIEVYTCSACSTQSTLQTPPNLALPQQNRVVGPSVIGGCG